MKPTPEPLKENIGTTVSSVTSLCFHCYLYFSLAISTFSLIWLRGQEKPLQGLTPFDIWFKIKSTNLNDYFLILF